MELFNEQKTSPLPTSHCPVYLRLTIEKAYSIPFLELSLVLVPGSVVKGHCRFCYVIFNSHMFNAPRFNSEEDVSLQKFLL
jgi:hypothetical protein